MVERERKCFVFASEIVEGDGTRTVRSRAFCGAVTKSVDLGTCRACNACAEVGGDATGSTWVVCTVDRRENADSAIGATLHGTTLSVRHDMPIAKAASLLVEYGLPQLFVVDDQGHLLGTLRDVDLLRSRRRSDDVRTALSASSLTSPLREDETVHDALVDLAHTHARQAAVVDAEGTLVGTALDLDALHTLTEIREKKRT